MAEVNKDLRELEIFEIEVLELLNSSRLLDNFYLGGDTMLRLCHNLNRYSTDLDFWRKAGVDQIALYAKLNKQLSEKYQILDSKNKFHTIIFQIRSAASKRSLKIEIRKEQTNFEWERKIAFSRFTTKQIQLNGLTLNQMMKNKIAALISRKIIRDAFDIDFLLKRGVQMEAEKEELAKMLDVIESFKARDFKVTLGSLLDSEEREFYNKNKFSFLKEEIIKQLR